MKPPTLQSQKKLIEKINSVYKVGDKIKVRQDDSSVLEWTVQNEATLMGGHTAMIWCEESRGAYMASRVIF